ncbi:MAG: methylated-DNA--[protein]-cysteine S-methyltransferase [Candidatus Syntrophoarchaeum sp.]|nr:methylated-DNA--[protein]-cysteine S-methyltransferase [Candidatus Syntrophoarchaeum sp.]
MIYRVIFSSLLDRYLLFLSDEDGLRLLIRRSEKDVLSELEHLGSSKKGGLSEIVQDTKTYLEGRNVDFSRCKVDMERLTQFERKVIEAVRAIPYGSICTYAELAELIGERRAYRAVGQALGKNPAPIIIPCHRVVAKRGIGGYAWGIEMKKKLLALERGDALAG